jgi:hypothetical protein
MSPLSLISRAPQPQFRRRQPRHAEFLGLPFALLHQAEVIRIITEQGGAPYRYIVTPNSHHVATVHGDPQRLLPIYQAAWLSLCDSRVVRALARFDRLPLPLVTGSDLVATLLAALNAAPSEHAPRRILVVGPRRAVEDKLRQTFPKLTIDVLPAPGALGQSADRRLAVARLHQPQLGHSLALRRLPGAGIDRATACEPRLPIRHRALRRRLDRLSHRTKRASAGLAAEDGPRMGLSARPRAGAAVAALSDRIAEDLPHLHGRAGAARAVNVIHFTCRRSTRRG